MKAGARFAAKAARPSTKILAERGVLDRGAKRRALRGHAAHDRVDGALGAADRPLAQSREIAGVFADASRQRLGRDEPVDEADRQRFGRRDAPAAEQQVLGARRADEFDQLSRLDVAVEEAELGGGDREVRVLGAEPQIAAERDGEPAADRDAARARRSSAGRARRALARPCWIAST